jgi:hypothetical protein
MGPRTILLLILIVALAALYTPVNNLIAQYIQDKNVVTVLTVLLLLSILASGNHLFEKVLKLKA